MMKQEQIIPVYLVTGFLESGKTKLITSMVTDENFSRGSKTLIICCEDGMEEYEDYELDRYDTSVVMVNSPEELTALFLKQINKKYAPERVIIEYNSVWGLEKLGGTRLPPMWEYAQIITLADATTFSNYMTNMRKMITDPMKEADLIMVNRCSEDFPKSEWRRQLRALNPGANILFENMDGTADDGVSDEDLPYDMKAEIIEITEEQLGIFYLDSLDHPDRYDGKTVRFAATPYPDSQFPAGYYLFGREAMTCCSNDIQKVGWITKGDHRPNAREFMELTACCHRVTNDDESQSMLMLEELSMKKAPAPKEKYMTFGPTP